MFFIFLGVLLFIGGNAISNPNLVFSKYSKTLKAVGAVFAILGLTSSAVVQVDAGEVGVQSVFGKVQTSTLNSGLNFVNPLAKVVVFDAKTQNYTMSSVHDEGDKAGDDAIRVLTADGLEVVVDLTVLFRIIPSEAPRVLREIGEDYKDKVVRPITRTMIRDNAVYYDAVALYSLKRNEFQQRIYQDIEKNFKKRGLVLEQLLIRNINLPTSVKTTIESKINAEQDAQKMQFVLQKEKQEAERKRVDVYKRQGYRRLSENFIDRSKRQTIAI
jgi:regulator of protease activity HflC (stomatin/prohibitin superfamily)